MGPKGQPSMTQAKNNGREGWGEGVKAGIVVRPPHRYQPPYPRQWIDVSGSGECSGDRLIQGKISCGQKSTQRRRATYRSTEMNQMKCHRSEPRLGASLVCGRRVRNDGEHEVKGV